MFSNICSGAFSRARSPVTQDMNAYLAALPAVSRIGNVVASGRFIGRTLDEPVTEIDPPEDMVAGADALQVLGNRRLRAAFAYGEVMRLLFVHPRLGPLRPLLVKAALGLREAVRVGCIPSNDACKSLTEAGEACGPKESIYKALHSATIMISDNENHSLDELSDERVHLAHLVVLAVLAADASSGWQAGSLGSAEVICGLAACSTLGTAKEYLEQPVDSMSPAGKFRQHLGLARAYLAECSSNPEFRPNRFPLESPWKDAIDRFFC